MSRRIIIVDKDLMTGQIDERFMLEGNYEQLGDFFKALKRMCLGLGYHPENVEAYFGDCENWEEQDKWNDTWKQWRKRQEAGDAPTEKFTPPPSSKEKESCGI